MRMICLLLVFSFGTLQSSACTSSQMIKVRNLFHAARTEAKLQTFFKYVKTVDCSDAKPYLASAIMQQAQYCYNPISKLKYFNKGKAQLEAFIAKHPQNIEARYVRVLVQKSVPAMLGYKSNIISDKKFITSQINKSQLSDTYQRTILKYINV